MDKVGLVTITYNSAGVLHEFLNCFSKQTYKNIVLYVIDNNSNDATFSILEKHKKERIIVIKNSNNVGVAKANNQGIIKAIKDNCDHILIINNDVKFEYFLVEKLLKVQADNGCSLVVPKMMYYDSPKNFWYAGSWFNKSKGYLPLHRGMGELDLGQFDKVIEVEYAPTCCVLIKKQVFSDIGFMDEKYFVYFDDTDFSYRILIDGRHKIVYYPFVSFYHKVGALTKSTFNEKGIAYRGNFFLQQNICNHVYFLRKIGNIFSYMFIFWLFFKNNIRFIINPRIRKDFFTWLLINKSYFKGFRK